MKRLLISVCIALALPIFILAQEKEAEKKSEVKSNNIPSQAIHCDKFSIGAVYFNKVFDDRALGDVLEVCFELKSKIDVPQDLYVFVIATYENIEKVTSSFKMPIVEKDKLLSFVPFPDDVKNFEYDDSKTGKTRLLMYPKNTKAGVDPETGKPYTLKSNLFVRTRHFTKYRNNYVFFNNVAIVIFNEEGKLLFRQLYEIVGKRK